MFHTAVGNAAAFSFGQRGVNRRCDDAVCRTAGGSGS
jgi:hypothetical protein